MNERADGRCADGPGVSGGGRCPSALAMGPGGRGGPLAPGQRWSVARKREVVLRLLRSEAAEDLSRELGVPVYPGLTHEKPSAERDERIRNRVSSPALRGASVSKPERVFAERDGLPKRSHA